MKVLGTSTALATGTTKFITSTAVWVNNTNTSAGDVTVRNSDDDANVGTISIPPNTGIVIHLEVGQGLRGASTMKGTQVDNSAGR
jgi:hypothetical protein